MRLAWAAFIGVLALSGCGGKADTTVDVEGVWLVTGAGVEAEVTYRADGTYRIQPIVGDGIRLTGFDFGTYEVDGLTLTYTSTGNPSGCRAGDTGEYAIKALEGGDWEISVIEDECAERLEGNPFTHRNPTD